MMLHVNVLGIKSVFIEIRKERKEIKKRRGNIPRDVAIWLFHGSSRWTLKEIGEEFGISYGAAGKAAKRVENAAGKDSKL